jgi:hypothetical protein
MPFIKSHRSFFSTRAKSAGRPKHLWGVGGLAAAFIEMSAVAVIAPFWSVDDESACAVASEFYDEIKRDPTKPFSEILAVIRKRAFATAGTDTYASYCFF